MLDHFLKISVRCRYQPDVQVTGLPTPQALKLLFLQHSQQLWLQCQWNIADLVQEERSPVGHLKPAYLLSNGPGKSPLLVTEQFAL